MASAVHWVFSQHHVLNTLRCKAAAIDRRLLAVGVVDTPPISRAPEGCVCNFLAIPVVSALRWVAGWTECLALFSTVLFSSSFCPRDGRTVVLVAAVLQFVPEAGFGASGGQAFLRRDDSSSGRPTATPRVSCLAMCMNHGLAWPAILTTEDHFEFNPRIHMLSYVHHRGFVS